MSQSLVDHAVEVGSELIAVDAHAGPRKRCYLLSRDEGAKAWTTPRSDIPIQGLGLMRLTDDGWGDDDRDPGLLVQAAVEAGVLLDTAEMYGNEELVGQAVAAQRDQVTLCSKFGVY